MSTGQMLLSTFALALLGFTMLSTNTNNLQQGTVLRQTEIGIYAISLATSYLQKAEGLNYDEATIDPPTGITSPTQFSAVLGRDAGEPANVDTLFDDFDDYNGFDKADTIQQVGLFNSKASVYYLTTVVPFTESGTRSIYKQMDIRVASSSVSRNVFESTHSSNTGVDTIKMSYIFSYF